MQESKTNASVRISARIRQVRLTGRSKRARVSGAASSYAAIRVPMEENAGSRRTTPLRTRSRDARDELRRNSGILAMRAKNGAPGRSDELARPTGDGQAPRGGSRATRARDSREGATRNRAYRRMTAAAGGNCVRTSTACPRPDSSNSPGACIPCSSRRERAMRRHSGKARYDRIPPPRRASR